MADTKNFGLKGVGDDVQLGKAGPRINLDTGNIEARNAADSAYVNFRVLDPVVDADAATKLYVDNVAAGLDPKESCTCATTGNIGTYNSSGGAAGNGQLTSVAATIDGVTLVQGDRVLVKDQSTATQNGIYVVTATTTTLDRATDHDSNAEVNAGNFTFIEEGTNNADSGWVLQGPDPLTINTSNLNWALFSTSSDIVAGIGLVKNGNVLDFNIAELTSAATIATADELVFDDGGVESRITVANFLADRDIVTATANGMLARTANDTYASRTLTASAVAGDQGISIVNGDGVSGNPTIGLDITGLGAITTVDLADTVAVFDGTNNVEATFTDIVQDLDIPNAISTNGIVTRTAADTYTSRSVAASAVAGDEGISVVNGDGVSGNITIGVDILGQTNIVTDDIDDADELLIYHSVAGGTEGLGNYAVTASKLKTYMNAGTSSTSITEGDTTLAVSDSGANGTLTYTADATQVFNVTDTTFTFENGLDLSLPTASTITVADLTNNDVLIAGTGGLIEDSGGLLTFDGTTLTVTGAAAIDEITIDGDTISNNTTDQPIIIRPNGTGSIILQNGSSEEILELNDTASAVNGLAISAGATGNPAQITTGTGSEANIDIGFLTNGTGVLSVTAGSGNYEDNVTAEDDIPNKKYVDDAIEALGGSGSVDTIIETISLAVPGVLTIGSATGIPANCTILSTMVDITVATDTAVTVTVGDTTNGAASYMAATENDPEVIGTYIADGRLLNGGSARQANATVGGVDGTVGTATIIITFRHA